MALIIDSTKKKIITAKPNTVVPAPTPKVTAPATTSAPAPKVATTANDKAYINKLATSGTAGQQAWAKANGGVAQVSSPTQPGTIPEVPQVPEVPEFTPEPRPRFDTSGIATNMYDGKAALIQAQLDSTMNSLDNNFNTNVMNYNNQVNDVGQDFYNQNEQINQDAYRNIQRNKLLGVNRGVMNTGQQQAMDQGTIRAGNTNRNQATMARDNTLQDIMAQIGNLGQSYGNDKLTAQKNANSGLSAAMSESQLAQLQADMNMYQFDENFNQQKDLRGMDYAQQDKTQAANFAQETLMQGTRFEQEKAMFGLQSALQMQMQRISEAGANGRASMSNSLGQQELNYRIAADKNSVADQKKQAQLAFTTQLLQSNPNYNPNAQVTWWDKFTKGTNASNASVDINKQIMSLNGNYAGVDPALLQQYFSDAYYTDAANGFGNNGITSTGSNPMSRDNYLAYLMSQRN